MNKKNKPKMQKVEADIVQNYEELFYWMRFPDHAPLPFQQVLCINIEDRETWASPVKAIFKKHGNKFISLEDSCSLRLEVSHWIPIPKFDIMQRNEGDLR